jgi:hypothetical protein
LEQALGFVLLADLLHALVQTRLGILAVLLVLVNELVEAGADLLLLLTEELVGLGEVLVGVVQVDRFLLERRHLVPGVLDVLLEVLDALGRRLLIVDVELAQHLLNLGHLLAVQVHRD